MIEPRRTVRLAAWVGVVAALLAACGSGGADDAATPAGEQGDSGGLAIVEREATGGDDVVRVLFLHGAAFTSEIWVTTGVLDAVAEAGHDAVAVDLPGHGESPASAADPADTLRSLLASVDEGSGVVVVAPSMAGSYALPLLEADGPGAMAGFVGVAPVGIDGFVSSIDDGPLDLPALVVWGEDDAVIAPAGANVLAGAFADASVTLVPGAGHAVYEDDPDAFIGALDPFLTEVDAGR